MGSPPTKAAPASRRGEAQLSLRIPKARLKALKLRCLQRETSIKDTINALVESWLKK